MQDYATINVLTAPSHPDPYPYYASLRQGPGLLFDAERQCWIASRAYVVQQVLESLACAVRPMTEPVPANIRAGSAGQVFSYLMRMNEGQAHSLPKQVMQTSLRTLDVTIVSELAQHYARQLDQQLPALQGAALTSYLFALPIHVMGTVLGFRQDALPELTKWMGDFVRCLSPLSSPEQINCAHLAAQSLQANFRQILEESAAMSDSFLASLQNEAHRAGWINADALLANIIGLLSQTYEATAGLSGNCITALHRDVELFNSLQGQGEGLPQKVRELVAEVARHDAPVQNTRRFVTQACQIAGQDLPAGAVIVVLLASANRDPAANADADVLQLHRPNRKVFTFGHGRHACPGQAIAEQISSAVLMHLLSSGHINWQQLNWTYRPSLNGRIPVFQ